MSPRLDARERLYLVRANRYAIAVMLERALGRGLEPDSAVVVVVAQRDEVGKALAALAAERAGLDAAQEGDRVEKRGDVPTMILVLDLRNAVALFSATHPGVAAGLTRAPLEGRIRVVAIAAGAAMLVHTEISRSFVATPIATA